MTIAQIENLIRYVTNAEGKTTLAQRRGGHPKHLLLASPDISLRENRKKIILEYIQSHHQKSKNHL